MLPPTRRNIIGLGVAMTSVPSISPGATSSVRTSICDLLGIEYPIIQAPMGQVAGPELVAAVCRAGGMGVLAGANLSPDELRERIRQIRKLTDQPFGVNLLLHTAFRPPADPQSLSEDLVRRVQSVLNRFRAKLGLEETFARPPRVPDTADAAIDVILEERVPVFSVGLGNPSREIVRRCHERGAKVMAMVSTVDDAREVAGSGVDIVVAQGSEAGGHRSTWVKRESREHASIGTLALVPQIVDAVKVPVLAAGGISDGRGVAAALALGASGAFLGTRFLATRESIAPEFHKRAVIDRSSDTTTVTDVFTGLYARVLRNAFTEEYAASGTPVMGPLTQFVAAGDIFKAAAASGNPEYFPLYCGQGNGLIRDIPSAEDLVRTIVQEATAVIARLPAYTKAASA